MASSGKNANKRAICKTRVIDLGNVESAEICVSGDWHIGDPAFNKKLLRGMIDWGKEKENRYYMFTGDMLNCAIASSVSDTHKEIMDVDSAIDILIDIFKEIGPEKILSCVVGNHCNRNIKTTGVDPLRRCCELAGVPYDGIEAYLTLKVGDYRSHKDGRAPVSYHAFMTHGVGGGRAAGSSVNAVQRHANTVVASIYAQGHSHKPSVTTSAIYEFDSKGESIVEREQIYVVNGSLLNRDGYAKSFCFAPISHKFPVITLCGHKKKTSAELIEL
jgi:hypothetical protein